MERSYFLLFSIFFSFFVNAQNSFYDVNNINTIEIFFAQSNWDQIMDNHYSQGNGDRLIADSVIINGASFDSVGVKYKGNSSYNVNNSKNPLNLKLDYVKDQDYQGYYTFKLSNGDKDPTFVREVLSYFISRHYMDAPKANYANVYINGGHIGLYGNIESINKKFVEERFYSDDDNTLFKCNPQNLGGGGNPNCVQGIGSSLEYLGTDTTCYEDYYELQSDFGWEQIKNLTYNFDQNPSNIEQYFDIDRGIWFLALNNLFVNMDSYIGPFCQNYYLFRDDNNRFLPIVWDFNESFGHFSMINTPGPGNPPANTQDLQEMDPFLRDGDITRPLCNLIYGTPIYRRMYVAHMRTIIEEFFTNNYYYQKGDSLHDIISSAFQADQNSFYTWSQAIQNLTSSLNVGQGAGGGTKVGIKELMDARSTYVLSHNEFQLTAPTISNISLSTSSPSPYSTVDISANITSTNGSSITAHLGYRNNPGEVFNKLPMIDQGGGIFKATINVYSSDIEYYLYAENTEAGAFSPERAEYEFYIISVTGDIVINEIMSSNTIIPDQDGEYEDWIELYNNTNTDINLLGYYLSDNSNFFKWAFPDTFIAANSYLIIWADENGSESGLHANFKLNASGEQICLYDSISNKSIDQIVFGPITKNLGYARVPNGIGSCIEQSHTFNQNNETTISVSELILEEDITLYPNPATKVIQIKSKESSILSIEIFNIYGKKIIEEEYLSGNLINILSLSSGMYLIKINSSTILKLIKQ